MSAQTVNARSRGMGMPVGPNPEVSHAWVRNLDHDARIANNDRRF